MPATASGPTKKTPARMSRVFSQMLAECPQDIHVYGACVAGIHGAVERQACEAEFAKLRQCFQRVLRSRK